MSGAAIPKTAGALANRRHNGLNLVVGFDDLCNSSLFLLDLRKGHIGRVLDIGIDKSGILGG